MAECLDLRVVSQGKTLDELTENLKEALRSISKPRMREQAHGRAFRRTPRKQNWFSIVLRIMETARDHMQEFSFDAHIFREGDTFVAYVPALDVSSCGAADEEARQNIRDAVRGFIAASADMGTLSYSSSSSQKLHHAHWPNDRKLHTIYCVDARTVQMHFDLQFRILNGWIQ